MPENLASSVADEADTSRRQQDHIAYLLEAYERAKASGVSQQDFAASQDILRSSLHTPEISITRQVVKWPRCAQAIALTQPGIQGTVERGVFHSVYGFEWYLRLERWLPFILPIPKTTQGKHILI